MAINSIFDLDEFKPLAGRFYSRKNQYIRYRRYYDGSIYGDTGFKFAHKLYAQTKALFSFLARAVDLDVALVPGIVDAWALDTDDSAILVARDSLYSWSRWSIESDAWIEDGAMLGEAMIKIVPVVDIGTVQLQRLQPELCMIHNSTALIVDNTRIDNDGKIYEYSEIITPEFIRLFKNGEPFDYDGSGAMYENPIGFIPIIVTENDTNHRPTFSKMLPQLDSVNELASYLADIIGRHAEPQWAAFGVEQGDMSKSGNNIWFFPNADSKLQAILASVDIEGTLKFIETIKSETKSNLPELAFDDLRAKDQIATESLKVQLIELQAKISKMRRRYDSALVQAHQMAALIASIYSIVGIESLLQPHKMRANRPILPINELEEIQLQEARLGLEMATRSANGDGFAGIK